MIQFKIIDDRLYHFGEVEYLGIPAKDLTKQNTPPENWSGYFPFMRMCYSLGDLAIVSSLPEAFSIKYPNLKFVIPTNEYVARMMGPELERWSTEGGATNAFKNVFDIFQNNPYLYGMFETGQFKEVFTDHDRSCTGLIHDGEMIRSVDEPLAEQIARRFGFTEEDVQKIDLRPKLYFSEEEKNAGNKLIDTHVGTAEFGCLLFSSRLDKFNTKWDTTDLLLSELEPYRNLPVFIYSTIGIEHDTKWKTFFSEYIDFKKLGLSIREQLYIKSLAKFNSGYQAGITDAVGGSGTKSIVLCPYKSIRENCIRGVTYIFGDGNIKQF